MAIGQKNKLGNKLAKEQPEKMAGGKVEGKVEGQVNAQAEVQLSRAYLPYARHGVDSSDREAVLSLFTEDEQGTRDEQRNRDEHENSPRLAQGTKATDFEQRVLDFTGARYAIACANGTAALHASMVAIGLCDAGNELGNALDAREDKDSVVITQAISFCATANVIRHCGARPIFADIDEDSVGLCPHSTREALLWARKTNKRVKAIMPVHMGGVAHASEELRALSREFQCYLVEDAAHALGGRYDNSSVVGNGSYADISVFSSHAVKPITSGEGGIAVTNDTTLAKSIRQFCNHGIEREEQNFQTLAKHRDRAAEGPQHYEMQKLGLNYRLSELQAALGASQMLRLESKRERRREIAEHYDQLFIEHNLLDIIQPLQQDARRRSAHHLYLVAIDWHKLGMKRRKFMQELDKLGIGTQVHYIPIFAHPYYQKQDRLGKDRCYIPLELERTRRYAERTLSLPLFAEMGKEDAQYVVESINSIIQ